jgi:formylglycine-generating enzyme required for sulfatase activity/mono/diheme cytochrome c family protein
VLARPIFIAFLAFSYLIAAPVAANAQDELAKKAKAILEKHCAACHFEKGNEGGFDVVLDQQRLLQRNYIVPKDLSKSLLYERMLKKEMPPGEVESRPSDAEIAVIKQWIEAGAADFNPTTAKREFISTSKVLEIIRDDLKGFDPRDRKFIRYFTLSHLYNAGFSESEMQSYRAALSKLVNSLSWNRDIVKPEPIGPGKSILRINLTNYDWDEKTWDAIIAANPYGITYSTAAERECCLGTHSNLPYVRGDWFVHAAARPPLYHTILRLPKTDKELEKELRIDAAENIRKELVLRAGFRNSGVSQNNRLLEWHKTGHGAYWKSYDFAGRLERKDLFQHPLGPGDNAQHFLHDGGEIIFNLPNHLQAYMLIDGKGNRIDKGPTTVVVDKEAVKRGQNPEVVNGISCMSCHAKGMIFKDDKVRDAVIKAKGSFSDEDMATILRLYAEKKDFDKKLTEATTLFEQAVKESGASFSTTEPIVALSSRFEKDLDLTLAAAEAGVTLEEFLKGLDRSPAKLGKAFSLLRVDGGTVTREVFVDQFSELVRVLALGRFRPPIRSQPIPGEERAFEIAPGLKMVFCWIPPSEGMVKLGSPKAEKERSIDNEEHDYQTAGFWLAKFPVTQDEWQAVMGNNPSNYDGKKETSIKGLDTRRFPVENVSWNDCQEYVKKLNGIGNVAASFGSNGRFSLPHEDQWEYAVRGGRGNQQPFYWGHQLNGTEANCYGDYPYGTKTTGKFLNRPCAVDFTNEGKYEKHPWGLCHMTGNVLQLCENTYDGSGSDKRVARGGSYLDLPKNCRSASRDVYSPNDRFHILGFRVGFFPVFPKGVTKPKK